MLRASALVLVFTLGLLLPGAAPAAGATPSPPAPGPLSPDRHIFYGDVPPNSEQAPVLVFVHGLKGTAFDWWVGNDMYVSAWRARYRTAFVSLSRDNSPNDASVEANGLVLRDALPAIAAHYRTDRLYLVGHSKGGVDAQAAMLYPRVAPLVKAVFTISAPNQGTELADWAFGPGVALAGQLGLLTPGVFSMRTDSMARFRALADPVLRASDVPFFTVEGESFRGHPVTAVTGRILKDLVPTEANDGFVTVPRGRLDSEYASDLGGVGENHFATDAGSATWAMIAARVQGLENTLAQLDRVVGDGLGDPHNTFIWSMKWFKGRLYVGTGREVQCISLRTADVQNDSNLYASAVRSGQCPELGVLYRSLAAEIWRYTPQTGRWDRVFKSPESVPVTAPDGAVVLTARDVGFRGMAVYTGPSGVEELWVGGVNSGTIFEHMAPYRVTGFPPPRLLHSPDGERWFAVPQRPGTFLEEIGHPRPGSTRRQRTFRALTQYGGLLVATVGDYRGVGMIVASANPAAGDDAWFAASPIPERFPVWNLTVFNGLLYCTTGDKQVSDSGYGVFKTAAQGPPPWRWAPVITRGGYQADARVRSPNGLSFGELDGQLYVGTNRPTELVRVNPDDTWDLLVGEPRQTPQGFKTPLSGMGIGFGSWFNGHFWRMGTQGGDLFIGTWDWSIGLRTLPRLDRMFGFQYGFDLLRSSDGVEWRAVSRTGLGDGLNFGGRSFEPTPLGLFVGTARPQGGAEVYRCARPDCRTDPLRAPTLPAPRRLRAASEVLTGRTVVLSWLPVAGAARYRVYRMTVRPLADILPLGSTVRGGDGDVTVEEAVAGALDGGCAADSPDAVCSLIEALRDEAEAAGPVAAFPGPVVQVGIRSLPSFTEPAPTDLQSIYFVRAEDADGHLSEPSNFVGGPSKAGPFIHPLP